MRILILEDDRDRVRKFKALFYEHEVHVTRFPEQANQWLEEMEFDVITLDHDLAEEMQGFDNNFETGTGLEVANYLGNNLHLSPKAEIYVHSLNGGGARRMISAMKQRGDVPHVPFLWLKEITFNG